MFWLRNKKIKFSIHTLNLSPVGRHIGVMQRHTFSFQSIAFEGMCQFHSEYTEFLDQQQNFVHDLFGIGFL